MTDFNMDEMVELGGGRRKKLRDCTAEDLGAATEFMARMGIRTQAAAERLENGQPPLCAHQDAHGIFCEREAEYLLVSRRDDRPVVEILAKPSELCAKHKQELGV